MTTLGLIPSPQFVSVRFSVLENPNYNELSGNAIKLYLKLRRFIWRSEKKGLLAEECLKGNLAVEGYLSQWGSWLRGASRPTVSRILAELEKIGWLRWVHRSSHKGDPNILILGHWFELGGDRIEIYYADTSIPLSTVSLVKLTVSPVKGTNREDTNREPSNKEKSKNSPSDFSDYFPGQPRNYSTPKFEIITNLLKEILPPESYNSLLASGRITLLRKQLGETDWTSPPVAKLKELNGEILLKSFCEFVGINAEALTRKERRNWIKTLSEPLAERELDSEIGLLALGYVLNFDWGPMNWMKKDGLEPVISTPFHKQFQEHYNAALRLAISGTLGETIERRKNATGSNSRSSSGQQAQRGGPSEDARRRGAAFDVVTERRRREAEQEVPLLRGAPDPSA